MKVGEVLFSWLTLHNCPRFFLVKIRGKKTLFAGPNPIAAAADDDVIVRIGGFEYLAQDAADLNGPGKYGDRNLVERCSTFKV